MFCSKCGNQVNAKLKYCNVCGAKTAKDEEAEGGKISPLNALITTLSFVALFGLGILVGLVGVLLKNSVPNDVLIIIAVSYLITLFGICFSLTRLMSKLIDAKTKAESSNQAIPLVQLPAPNTAQLEEMKQPFSVVENTTRTFDEEFVKRN